MALLCIGDELLDGRTADRNAHFLGQAASDLGVPLRLVSVVDDQPHAIAQQLRALTREGRLVITSGGLGPTLDDRTREAISIAVGEPLVHDETAEARIRARFTAADREWTEANARQAWFPRSATVLPSSCGTADAFVTVIGPSEVLSLPGVPREFQTLFEQYGAPMVVPTDGSSRCSQVFYGLGESAIAEAVEQESTGDVAITYKATSPYVEVGVRGRDAPAVEAAFERICERLAPWSVPDGHTTYTHAVASAALSAGASVATVESCTGGLIAEAMTDLAGASRYYWGGWVTYDNDAKTRCVGVDPRVLADHGAVSAPVAVAMALGAIERSGVDAAVSVTGIAGPGGGSPEKPVGLVYVGVVGPSASMVVKATFAGRDRASFRRHVAALAQRALLESLVGWNGAFEAITGVEWCRTIE